MATDIDVPFLPSAAQIRRREFASVRRGYDPDQVRDYLAQVAEQVEMLEQEVRETKLQPAPSSGAGGATAPAAAGSDGSVRAARPSGWPRSSPPQTKRPSASSRRRAPTLPGCSTRPVRTPIASAWTRRRGPRRPASRGTSCWSARSRKPIAYCSASPSDGRRWSSTSRTCRRVWSASRRSSRSPSRIPRCRRRPSPMKARPRRREAECRAPPRWRPDRRAGRGRARRPRSDGGRRRARRSRRPGEHARATTGSTCRGSHRSSSISTTTPTTEVVDRPFLGAAAVSGRHRPR